MVWYVMYAVAHLVFAVDFYLDRRGIPTISERVWESDLPVWPWYVAGLVGFNMAFWFISGPIAALSLAMFLVGHFAR